MNNTTTTTPADKILDRIAKLLALYEDDRAPQGERDNALSMAQALMLKHSVEEAMLRRTGTKSVKPMMVRIETGGAYSPAKETFLYQLAKVFRCRAILLGAHRNTEWRGLEVFGFEDDVRTVETLWASLSLQMASACERAYCGQGRTWKNNYYLAFGSKVVARLRENNRLNEADLAQAEPGMGLALRDITSDVDAAFNAAYPKTQTKSVKVRTDTSGALAGTAGGARADISGGRNNLGDSRRGIGA